MSVFRNLDCLSLVFCSNTTLLKLQPVLFLFFFQILRFEIGGVAYLWMRLIHGHLRYCHSLMVKLYVLKSCLINYAQPEISIILRKNQIVKIHVQCIKLVVLIYAVQSS